MNKYIVDLNQDEINALFIVVGSIAGSITGPRSKVCLKFITGNIWRTIYKYIPDKSIVCRADGIIWSTSENFIS